MDGTTIITIELTDAAFKSFCETAAAVGLDRQMLVAYGITLVQAMYEAHVRGNLIIEVDPRTGEPLRQLRIAFKDDVDKAIKEIETQLSQAVLPDTTIKTSEEEATYVQGMTCEDYESE